MDNTETYETTIVDETQISEAPTIPTELITVEQLPIINEQLERVKEIIDNRTADALSLECTEDNRKQIKDIRAMLNKEHSELDRRYKSVMDEVLAPALAVQKKYKECTEGYKNADTVLKERIGVVENTLKDRKREVVKAYFDELAQSKGIDFISFDDMGLKIGLASSEKSLKTAVNDFLGRVACDLKMIRSRDDADEILIEYKQNGFQVSDAVNIVAQRRQRIENERKRRIAAQEEELRREQAAQEAVNAAAAHEEDAVETTETLQPPTAAPVEPAPIEPIPDDDKIIVVNLNLGRFKASKGKIRKLKKVIFDFMENEGGFEKL